MLELMRIRASLVRLTGLGRICQTNNNCYVKDSYCVEGYCVCDHSQHSNPERTKCVKNACEYIALNAVKDRNRPTVDFPRNLFYA